MARAADRGWLAGLLILGAAAVMLTTRVNPMWLLAVGGILGGLGVL